MINMSEVKVKKEKKKLSKSAIVLIVGIVVIAIPVLVFVGILGISALQTGTPRNGSRFDNDLVNEITNDKLTTIENDLNTISNIESVEVVLSEGQLKIFIDTVDTLSEEDVDKIVNEAYTKVTSTLPISTYFTATDSARMYDLQINVYTTIEASPVGEENHRQYKFLHKNSAEETYQIDNLAVPKNADIAKELEGLDETDDSSNDSSDSSTESDEE